MRSLLSKPDFLDITWFDGFDGMLLLILSLTELFQVEKDGGQAKQWEV